ncbi:MAG: ROK family protein [Planctomycetia bacterium]|jgi:glucokinase
MTTKDVGEEFFAGVDLGGTTITAGIGTAQGRVLVQKTIHTLSEKGPHDVLDRIAQLVLQLQAETKITCKALGVGVPGLLDLKKGTTLFLPNLATQWRNIPIVEILGKSLGMPVRILNDVRTATLGEMWFGAGKNVDGMLFFSIGTGIGGGVVTHGRLLLGPLGSAGEIGHQTVLPEGPLCGCGNFGCLEAIASGPAIISEGIRLWKLGLAPMLMKICDHQMEKVSPFTMAQAVQQGDQFVAQVIHRAATFLGIGVANLVTSLHPDLVVLGGGVSRMGDLLIKPVLAEIQKRVRMFPTNGIRVECSKLVDGAGLLGAIALAAGLGNTGES